LAPSHSLALLLARSAAVSADNGGPIYWSGVGGANNWPLKGGKGSNWQGGVRVNSWASGGFIPASQRGKKLDGLVAVWDWYGTFATLAGVTDFTDKSAAAAGLPPVDSVPLWPYLSGAQPHSPRTVVELGSCATSDKGNDAFCGKRGTNTTVQGLIKDERQAGGGGLWKVLVGSVWQAGWTGPEFPNNTKNPAGKMNAFFWAFYC
jgi:arylsulfatase B